MSLAGLPPAHRWVLLDGLPVLERYGLPLAGGYVFRAHKMVHRPSQVIDFAIRDDTPLPEIAARVQAAFRHAGYGRSAPCGLRRASGIAHCGRFHVCRASGGVPWPRSRRLSPL
jgi:hypothetical protein